jgi:hypothetical protein
VTQPHDDGEDGNARHAPTLGDVVTRWRYTLTPTLYTDESSDNNELLWQLVLEQRAVRAWLVVLTIATVVLLPTALIVTALLLRGTTT